MIPSELLNLPNWVCQRSKIPIDPKTGENASSQDPNTWGTYEEAKKRTDVDGLGFVPRTPYIGVDLDDCVVDGRLNDFARDIVKRCNSYTEFSPSGAGVHILLKGELPKSMRFDNIELYQNGNYLTMTGRVLYPFRAIRTVTTDFLNSLIPVKTEIIPNKNENESWVLPALEAITLGGGIGTGRTPTFLRVIGSLKLRGLKKDEVLAFLAPWSEKYEYGADRLIKLVEDQFQRYPPQVSNVLLEDNGSISEFMKEIKPIEWIVPGLIAEGSINIIAGLGESRKTWIVNDLAIAVASGQLWLDKFPVKSYISLMVNQERPKAEVQRRFLTLMKARNLKPEELEGRLLIKSGTTIRINMQQSFDAFRRYIEKNQPKLICVDSFNTFHSLTEENRADMQFVFEKIKALRDEFGCAFVLLDHENKLAHRNNQQGDKAEAIVSHDKVAGSAAKSEVVEGMFVVRTLDENSSIMHHTKNTFGPKSAPIIINVVDQDDIKSSIKVVGQ